MPLYNFGAGPAMLPAAVMAQIQADLPNWHAGMSIMEISHRHAAFEQLMQQIKTNLRKLLAIPDNYEILFFSGGARAQFTMVPMNLLGLNLLANYLITGHWSKLAYQDATKYGTMEIVASSEANCYLTVPSPETWSLNAQASYLHYTDNESIHGVELPAPPAVKIPLVADMTSNILSKVIDVSKYAVIYASTQKNLGIAGLTLVIVDPTYIQNNSGNIPLLYDYKVAIQHNSMLNTPPIFALYVMGLMLDWVIAQGGVLAMEAKNLANATKLYNYLEQSKLYENLVNPAYRSRINIPFTLKDPSLEEKFLQQAELHHCTQLKGHKVVGGMRVSLYNAMPEAGVDTLINFMEKFQQQYYRQ